jgi:hypothetical protein
MFAAKAFAVVSLILAGANAALVVSTPGTAVQCTDTQITVSGATGQYYISVVPADDPCAHDALFESDALTGDSFTWKTNLPAGTQAVIVVDDDAGNEAWSGTFTIGAGDASCLNASSSGSASSAPSTSSSANDAYAPAPTQTSVYINNVPASASASSHSHSVSAPANAQQGNTPTTGAAFSNTQASLFTILTAMGVVAMAL